MVEFGFSHGLISFETFKLFQRHCSHLPDELNPEENNDKINDQYFPRNVTHRCNEIREIIRKNFEGSDIYGINRQCPYGKELLLKNPLFYNSQNTYKKTIIEKLKGNNNKFR